MRKLLLLLSLPFFFGSLHAQYNKGLTLYDRLDYYSAISKFKHALKPGNKNRTDALVKIGDCYRMLRDFKNSANYYKMAVESGPVDLVTHYYYGLTLKSINQYDEALKEFSLYLKDNPNDDKAKNSVKSCQEIKAALSLPKEYTVVNLTSLNTKNSEFCPVAYDKGLAFISCQKDNLVNIDKFDNDGPPLITVYYAEQKNDTTFSAKKYLSKKINSDFHDGPLCFSADLNTVYVTHVDYLERKKSKTFVNQPKIYFSAKKGNDWQKPSSFAYNSDDYCVAHPSLSEDGKSLYFASNMPGGKGGMDIWVCKKDTNGWNKPVNLGADINTSGNEEFPFVRKDGVLYFSSDGLPGFGGLDVFSARQLNGVWVLNKNEGQGINSFADDFGVYFVDQKKGYVSSNRDGGVGSDDIYMFTLSPKNIIIEGTVLLSKNFKNTAKNISVILEDDQYNHITSTRTNDKGYFHFENLKADKKYMVKIDENDANFKSVKRYYFASNDSTFLRGTVVNEKGEKYTFTNLPADPHNLTELEAGDVSLAGTLLFGQNPSKPIPNAHILLRDQDAHIIGEATTNFFGSFTFPKISSDADYTIEVDSPEGMKIPINTRVVLTNTNGKEIRVIRAEKSGKYQFNQLSSDNNSLNDMQVDENDLVMDLDGKILDPDKKKISGARVSVIDNKGDTLFFNTTDADGKFNFRKLSALKDYTLAVSDNEKTNKFEKIYITDPKENIVKALIKDFKNGFQYRILASEKTSLKEIHVDDPWLDVLSFKGTETTIQENVYYASGEYKLSAAGTNILDKVILVLKSNKNISIDIGSHTDSRGNDDFNLALSKKRAMFAADYITSQGINKARVKGIGYGETKIINKCANNISCTDEEHSKNRRTEFRILNAIKK